MWCCGTHSRKALNSMLDSLVVHRSNPHSFERCHDRPQRQPALYPHAQRDAPSKRVVADAWNLWQSIFHATCVVPHDSILGSCCLHALFRIPLRSDWSIAFTSIRRALGAGRPKRSTGFRTGTRRRYRHPTPLRMAPAANVTGRWETVDPQVEPPWGSDKHIGVRYSHAAVIWRGQMIISHGYFYNHKFHQPAWQSDTWACDLATMQWTRIHGPWNRDKPYASPSPRYSTSAVLDGSRMLMFGGDDGGHLKSPNNYVFNAHFDELWEFALGAHTWRLVPKAADALWPPKRALHGGAIVNGWMHIYGGLKRGDHWAYELSTGRWVEVHGATSSASPVMASEATHPGKRHALAMAASGDGRSLYLFGGNRHAESTGGKPVVLDDLWRFVPAPDVPPDHGTMRGTWTRLGSGSRGASSGIAPVPWPAPRGHHSMQALGGHLMQDVGLVIFGGAHCAPGCKCYNDTWLFSTESGYFTRVQVRPPPSPHVPRIQSAEAALGPAPGALLCQAHPAPIWRYRQSFVQDLQPGPHRGALYTFGGESYKPYMCAGARKAAPRRGPTGQRADPRVPQVPQLGDAPHAGRRLGRDRPQAARRRQRGSSRRRNVRHPSPHGHLGRCCALRRVVPLWEAENVRPCQHGRYVLTLLGGWCAHRARPDSAAGRPLSPCAHARGSSPARSSLGYGLRQSPSWDLLQAAPGGARHGLAHMCPNGINCTRVQVRRRRGLQR